MVFLPQKIFLVRHAQSEANEGRYFAGWRDSPLTQLGVLQARALRKRLKHECIGKAFCSDLGRAKKTLELTGLDCATIFSSSLREKNYGELEGVKWSAALDEHHINPFLRAPGGESAADVQKRVWSFFEEKVFPSREKKVLVVSHHTPLVSFACRLLEMSLKNLRRLSLGNAGLCLLSREEGLWRIKLWNSLSYLGQKSDFPLIPEKDWRHW